MSFDADAADPRVVIGEGLTKRYGDGVAAVDALRGVSVSFDSGTLTAIDVASLQVGTSLGLGTAQLPAAVAITQDSKYAYVLGTEIALLNTTVNGVYLPNMTLGATISVAGCVGTSIAVSPGGSHGGHGIQLRQRSIRFCIRR